MPTANKKIIFYAPDELVAWLEEKSRETGAPVSELCRRALDFVRKVNVTREAKPAELQWTNSLQVPEPPLFTSSPVDEIIESSVTGTPAKRPAVLVAKKRSE
jgi:hypothetical protein